MTKLFEFPNSTTIDLEQVWAVSPLLFSPFYNEKSPGEVQIKIFFIGVNNPVHFVLATQSEDTNEEVARRSADQVRTRLIERWGSDK